MDLMAENGFAEYKHMILTELKELKEDKATLRDAVVDLKLEVEKLKSKLIMHIILTSSAAAGGSAALEYLLK